MLPASDLATLVVYRQDLLELVASLGVRDNLPKAYCLALLERYVRDHSATLGGLPHVCRHLLGTPQAADECLWTVEGLSDAARVGIE
jgi:hypothetical protein